MNDDTCVSIVLAGENKIPVLVQFDSTGETTLELDWTCLDAREVSFRRLCGSLPPF